MRASLLRIFGVLLGLSLGLLFAVPAHAAGIGVTTGTVHAGSTIIVEGNVLVPPDNHLPPGVAGGGATVTLLSKAFPGGTASAPGTVNLTVMGDVSIAPGRFRGEVAIRGDAPSGDYTVTGIFAGTDIGTAHFTVVGTAVTPQPTAQPTAPATAQPGTGRAESSGTAQLPSWWPGALAGVLVLLLLPWVGIVLLWRRRL